MQIKCPKCGTKYNVAEDKIPEKGRRLRCSSCGEVFWRRPEDAEDAFTSWTDEKTSAETSDSQSWKEIKNDMPPIEDSNWQNIKNDAPAANSQTWEEITVEHKDNESPEITEAENPPAAENDVPPSPVSDKPTETTVENIPETEDKIPENENKSEEGGLAADGINEIFQRLSAQNEALVKEENEQPSQKKIWEKVRRNTGLMSRTTRRYICFLLCLTTLLLLYYFRYEIVRTMPFMEKAYAVLHIKSKILGEGLEFKNITRRSYEDDYVAKMEIKGFIYNKTKQTLDIPSVKLEILDENANVLQTIVRLLPVRSVQPEGQIPFSITVTKPSLLSKYVYLTFTETKK